MRGEAQHGLCRRLSGQGPCPGRQAGRPEPRRHPQAVWAAEGDVRREEAQGRRPHSQHCATVRPPDCARQGEGAGGVRREIRRERGRKRACAPGKGVVRRIQRMHRAQGCRRELQEADGALSEARPRGPGVPDKGKQGVLRRTRHCDVRTKAGQAPRGRQETPQGREGRKEERR